MGVEEGGTEEVGLACTPMGGTANNCDVCQCGQVTDGRVGIVRINGQ
jgi:hypothetical protein